MSSFLEREEFLRHFGWSSFFEMESAVSLGLISARVISEERGLYRVQFGFSDVIWASVAGKVIFTADGRSDFPIVGDWVLIDVPTGSDRGVIRGICPRRSVVQRKQAGASSDVQPLASNVDIVFVATSLNEDLNMRRLERYLSVAWNSGAVPIILLTKADLVPDLGPVVRGVEGSFPGVEVYTLSQQSFESADFLPRFLAIGKTCVVLGSSGIGKSTLVNFLIGREEIRTQEIRDDDGKGRHTTTSRSLYVTRFGGLIIDTPGMRELQLADHAEGVQKQFEDVEDLISQCRFGDCQHDTEPGCAVKEALDNRSLVPSRWESYQKLSAEVNYALRKQNKALAAEERRVWKRLGRQAKEAGKLKRRGGF